MSDFGNGKKVKTHRQHRCEWCYHTILKGETAHFYTGRYDDRWQNWYMHVECFDAYCAESSRYNDWEFSPGEGVRPASPSIPFPASC
jgi:hypothetical protein